MSKHFHKKNCHSDETQSDYYSVQNSFKKIRGYGISSSSQTQIYNDQRVRRNGTSDVDYNSTTGINSYNLYDKVSDKISALSDKNDNEHKSLRLELENKMEKMKKDIEEKLNGVKDDKKWLIGLIITIIVGLIAYFLIPYRQGANNQKDIIVIKTTIDENIKPTLEKLETHNNDISEKINQIQLQNQSTNQKVSDKQ